MIDLLVAFAVVLSITMAGACCALILHLSRTRETVARAIAGVRRDMTKIEGISRAYGDRLDRLDRILASLAEQEARLSAMADRYSIVTWNSDDRRKTDGQDV